MCPSPGVIFIAPCPGCKVDRTWTATQAAGITEVYCRPCQNKDGRGWQGDED